MKTLEEPKKSGFFLDITPLRHSKAFAKLWAGGAISQIGAQMTAVAIGMHVYDLTESTLAVSYVALWSLGPMIVAGLWGGMIADYFDRRLVSLISAIVSWVTVATLAILTFADSIASPGLYALAAINAVGSTILWSTKAAITPRLLPASMLPAASALHGVTFGAAVTVGPALAGIFASSVGFGWTYALDAFLFTAGFLGVFTLPEIKPDGTSQKPGLKSVLEGISFLKTAPNVRATFLYDIIAMTFGQPRVIFPAVGMLILGGGYVTAGLLTTAVAVGSLLSSIFSGWLGRVRFQGRAVTYAIALYGASVLGFGLVLLFAALTLGSLEGKPRLILIACAVFFLALSGAADNVSAIFRSTILQVATPDSMRGRTQGIFSVVVTGGPRVGDLFAGALTATVAVWAPPVVGGLAIASAMLVFSRVRKQFMAYDATNPSP